MNFITKTFKSTSDLAEHLKSHLPSFYFSSKTSTVIPYDKLHELLPWNKSGPFHLCDLSKIPGELHLLPNNNLLVKGSVSWEDAKNYLQLKKRSIMTSPTEQLALILAGVATSCTGERCFAFGNLRKQIDKITYLDYNGISHTLESSRDFKSNSVHLKNYQSSFKKYENFKNAPYPRFEKETDLMIGTEGQLGIVTEIELKTAPLEDVTHIFILLPRWEEDTKAHIEIFHKVQSYREKVLSCELLDSNCMNYLKEDEKLGVNQDVVFMEIISSSFEEVYEKLLSELDHVSLEQVFEITPNKFHHVRSSVPRAIFEENSKMGVVKLGTDVQVSAENYQNLFDYYREASKIGVRYCLFGHYGDAHLHFNYMPTKNDSAKCSAMLEQLYVKVVQWQGSPFAEHGIGLLKQKYIKQFWNESQHQLFKDLKAEYDPHHQFFPQGFMNL
jgi:FAD/FMN-containing dehydrogenase